MDPSAYALPVFLEEPVPSSFAARGRPATLKCRVAHAVSAEFVCNDEAVAPTSTSGGTVEGSSFLQVTLEVRRGQVMDVLGHYSCRCRAKSERVQAVSSEAVVSIACEYNSRKNLR